MQHKVNYVARQLYSIMSLAESCSVKATHSKIRCDPEWGLYLTECADELLSSDSDLLRAIHQSTRSEQVSMYDAHGISLVLGSIALKKVLVTAIPLPERASSNHRAEDNQRLLSTLPSVFSAQFSGRPADGDGVFRWKKPLQLTSESVDVGLVPLEVGSTSCWTTWEHIAFHGGVARLPYGSDYLYLFITVHSPFQSTL